MTQYKSLNHKNSKLNELYSRVQELTPQTPELTKPEPVEHSVTYLKKNRIIEVPIQPQFYDMYNWLGITYASGENSPEPESAYEAGYRGWYFKYPTFDFRVPSDSTPMAEVPGTEEDQWEYTRSIAIVNTSVFIKNLNEKFLNYIGVKTYLYNENNQPVASSEFSEIYRWHEENNGYTFHYNAFYGIDEEAESETLIKAELVVMNPDNYDALYQDNLS